MKQVIKPRRSMQVNKAIASVGEPDSTSHTLQALADGDALRHLQVLKDVANKYKDALSQTERALP